MPVLDVPIGGPAPGVVSSGLIFGLLTDVLNYACTALEQTTRGCPARHCVVSGSAAIEDDCCNGQLTVLAERIYPTVAFPAQADFSPCGFSRVAVDVLVSLRHCAPDAPCAQQSANAEHLSAEATVLWLAMICCLADWSDVIDGRLIDLRPSPGSPSGGCVGWDLRLTLGANLGCGCD